MSLELELQRCTAALEALTAVLGKTAIFPVIDTTPAKAEVAPPKPVEYTYTAFIPTAIPETTSTQATTAGIEYAQVAKAITDVFKVNRAKVIEVLAKFGAAKGPQLKPADYAAFLKELAA